VRRNASGREGQFLGDSKTATSVSHALGKGVA